LDQNAAGAAAAFFTERCAAGMNGGAAADSTLRYRLLAVPEAALQSGAVMLSGVARRRAQGTAIALELKGILRVAA